MHTKDSTKTNKTEKRSTDRFLELLIVKAVRLISGGSRSDRFQQMTVCSRRTVRSNRLPKPTQMYRLSMLLLLRQLIAVLETTPTFPGSHPIEANRSCPQKPLSSSSAPVRIMDAFHRQGPISKWSPQGKNLK